MAKEKAKRRAMNAAAGAVLIVISLLVANYSRNALLMRSPHYCTCHAYCADPGSDQIRFVSIKPGFGCISGCEDSLSEREKKKPLSSTVCVIDDDKLFFMLFDIDGNTLGIKPKEEIFN